MIDLLRDWRLSPFEKEAPAKAGIRAALCTKGQRWRVADIEATAIVDEALRRLGARRPTYEEGQREYVVPRENCAWCEGELPDHLRATTHSHSFCSQHCARTALLHRDLRANTESDSAYRAAWRTIEILRQPKVPCGYCGTPFRPRFGKERCCSPSCGAKLRSLEQGRALRSMRNCANCGDPFMAGGGNGNSLFCSKVCYNEHGATKRWSKTCEGCGEPFEAKSAIARACSKPCQHLLNGWTPTTLSRLAFDHFIALPVNAERGRILTPTRLDWFLMEQGLRITAEVAVAAYTIEGASSAS